MERLGKNERFLLLFMSNQQKKIFNKLVKDFLGGVQKHLYFMKK